MERTTRHAGYDVSQLKRKLVEEGFGWGKTIGGLRKLHHRGHREGGLDLHLHQRRVQPRANPHAHPRRGVYVRARPRAPAHNSVISTPDSSEEARQSLASHAM